MKSVYFDVHFLIQHSTGSPSHSNQKKGEIKGILIGKEEVKLSLFANDTILYIEKPNDSTKKLLELINEFSKVTEYKINPEISCIFICQ